MEDALRQYIDLYKENRASIDAHSATTLNDCRQEACRILSEIKLPRKGSENYEITGLAEILGHNYGLNINCLPLPVDPSASFRCGVPKMSTVVCFLVNDIFASPADFLRNMPAGLQVGSLRKFADEHPEEVSAFYNRLADPLNPLAALSTLLAQDGLWIRIPRGMRLEKPLQLVNLLGGSDNLMAVRRVVIVIEENAEAKILACDHTSSPDMRLLSLQTVEIFAARNSVLHFYDLEESSPSTTRLSTLWLAQKENSSVTINGMTIYNGMTRNEYHCAFAGPGSILNLYGLGIADKERVIDSYSRVNHDHPRCKTEELFKFSVDDDAKAAFTGLIKVAPGAEQTEAYQANRNLIGSDAARIFSKPQLEIYNDDVKCSHGSAVGRLDEMQLFYMRTRGIDEPEARLLLKQAFMADVIECVRIPGLRERLSHMVERRFAGEAAGCHDCNADCPSLLQ